MARNSVLTDEQSKLNARLEAHMVYICPECGKAFRTQVEWRQHLNTKHDYLKKTHTDFNFVQIDDKFHECQLCFKWVENAHKTIALLQYHYFMHLDHRETYRCVHCRLAYTRRRQLNEHLLNTHIKEIEKYELKLKRSQKQPEAKGTKRRSGSALQPRKRNDLLQKALMDIDLLADDPNEASSVSKVSPNSNCNANSSEQALDRCLNAYEDFVRKEKAQRLSQDVKNEEGSDVDAEPESKPIVASSQPNKEMVTIEIDAVGVEEMDKLQKHMKKKPSMKRGTDDLLPPKRIRLSNDESPPHKRKRSSNTPQADRDGDLELSSNGLQKMISYLCPQCGKEIDTLDDWRKHVFKKHDFEHFIEDTFKIKDHQSICLQCHEVQHTTKRSELQKHYFKHLPFRSYLKCTLCERTKTSMSKMYHHIRYNHQDELQRKNKTQLLIKPEPKTTAPQRSVKQQLESPENARDATEVGPEAEASNADEERMCLNCNKTFKTLWRFVRHGTFCRPPSAAHKASEPVNKMTVDDLLKHLREGQTRINAIVKKMELGAH